jgi:redox-sensitive bicupin YhaK (pirin superfamily)
MSVAMATDRTIRQRTAGHNHGPITRLVSPGDLGEIIKPFVFLDLISMPPGVAMGAGFGWHPHSGIATVTVAFAGDGWYADSTGEAGDFKVGGVEWMQAGGGVWHTGGPKPDLAADTGILGFQLWLALPEALENGDPQSAYVPPEAVPVVGPARVILGQHDGAKSPISPVSDLTYLQVTLEAGERWDYCPAPGHDVAWLALASGSLVVSGAQIGTEIVVFAPSETAISIHARERSQFVVGSAVPHPHRLVLGHYSVHSSAAALARGEAGIRAVQRRLHAEGRI